MFFNLIVLIYFMKLAEELTRKILSFDTRGGNEANLVYYLETELEEIGLQTKILEHGDNRASILAWTGALNKQKLAFNCHTDVVPYVHNYLYDQDDCIYAPGAVDTKKDIGPQLAVVKEMKDIPDGLVLAYDADEEYKNIGIKALHKYITAQQIVVNEPTNMQVHLGANGWTQIDVKTHGEQCHSNNSSELNAPEKLIHLMNKIKNEGFKAEDEIFKKSKIAMQHFSTGTKEHIRVEETANFFFTIAHNRNYDSREAVNKEMDRLIAELGYEGIYYEITDYDTSVYNPNSKLGEYMMKKFNLQKGIFFWWCNSQIFRDRDFVIFGMGDPLLCHTNYECVPKVQIEQSKEIYEKMILDLLKE